MPVVPNFAEKTIFLSLNQGPGPVLGLSYFHLLQGNLYAYDEVARWFREAGFTAVRRSNLLKAAGSSLIVGTSVS
jgi:hypothetical protein